MKRTAIHMTSQIRRGLLRRPSLNAVLAVPAVLALCTIASCSGDAQPRMLLFTTGTVIGIEASAAEGAEQHFIVGFKRFEGAIVPAVPDGKFDPRDEAYSVFATIGFSTGLGKPTEIVQVFGTGRAAETLAGSTDSLANITNAVKRREATFNVDSVAEGLRNRIVERLDDETPDPNDPNTTVGDSNYAALRKYLNEEGVTDSLTLWLYSAPASQLDAAIRAHDWN